VFGVETIDLEYKAENYEDILIHLGTSLYSQGFVKGTYIEAVLQREKIHPTGLPLPVPIAIPHTDPEHVLHSHIAVGTLKEPVQFSMMGTSEVKLPVQVVFMLAIKDPKKQPEILKQLMKIFQNEQLLNEISRSNEKKKVYELLSQNINL
jgi:galactitol PTS system EIIA component